MEPTQEEHVEGSNEVPLEDAEVFRGLRSLALQSMSFLVQDAAKIKTKILEAKTKPKKDYYTKKFNKVRLLLQDEVARLAQLEYTMKENGISLDSPEESKEVTAHE